MGAKNKDECGCNLINPKDDELHVLIKLFYGDRVFATDFILKGKDREYKSFLSKGEYIITKAAKTLAKEGILTNMDAI